MVVICFAWEWALFFQWVYWSLLFWLDAWLSCLSDWLSYCCLDELLRHCHHHWIILISRNVLDALARVIDLLRVYSGFAIILSLRYELTLLSQKFGFILTLMKLHDSRGWDQSKRWKWSSGWSVQETVLISQSCQVIIGSSSALWFILGLLFPTGCPTVSYPVTSPSVCTPMCVTQAGPAPFGVDALRVSIQPSIVILSKFLEQAS